MQSEPSRYIKSVSDLYETDEIEFLLDDIRELEPASCNPEDIQDFEIAGSRTGAAELGGLAAVVAGGGCGASGCECECDCECAGGHGHGHGHGHGNNETSPSPLGTVHSWDSHANYRHRLSASPDHSLFSGVIVYCDHTHLNSPTGIIRVLLVITTVACLTCLCTSGTVKVGLFMLPLVGRLRLMMFVTLLSLFVTSLLLFLDISHIVYLFPFNWGKVNAWIYVSISVLFLISSSLIFHMIFLSEAFSWVPKWTHQQLLVTGCLGYVCCIECIILTLLSKWRTEVYQPVAEDPSMTLQERLADSPHMIDESPLKTALQTTHNYKPSVSNYQIDAVPSTSRQNPHAPIVPPIDDVQPCSSKSVDPYRLA